MSRKTSKALSAQDIQAALYSSEDEEDYDESVSFLANNNYFVDVDQRLDKIQNNILTDDVYMDVDQRLDKVQNNLLANDHNSMDVDQCLDEIQNNVLSRELDNSSNNTEVVASASTSTDLNFRRERFCYLQNKQRHWSFTVENDTWPKFERKMEIKKHYTNRSQPLHYFLDCFPEELIDLIVVNTNIYANHTQSKYWTDVTKEEIKAYFGMIILISINSLPDITKYWSTDEFYHNPVISRVMPLKRFKKITENLHISNITLEAPRTSPNYDKLAKIRPAVDILNKTFKENVKVSAHNSVDESMIKFKGRSHMKQYMPKKPIKRGYKCWARADSYTGYLYEFQFYTGKMDHGTEENLGARVVMDLCETLPANTLVAFDNFFTSLPLLEILHEKGIYSVGTIRTNRKGLPDLITGKNLNRDMKKETALKPGEFVYQCEAPISVVKWKDTKDVFVATTAFDPKAIESIERKQKNGSKKQMFCPLAIQKYTQFMGGVDHFDHFRASYPLGRKSRKNWHRLFWFLLEAAVINSYIMYITSHSARRNSHKDFRLRLGRGLINNRTYRKIQAPAFKTKKGGITSVPDEVRKANVGYHWLKIIKFRRCRMCSTRLKEVRSKYLCKVCKVPLCPVPCHENFHQ